MKEQLPKIRNLEFSPSVNPLVEPQQIKTKRRIVKSGRGENLVNPATGEIHGVAVVHQVEERDDAEFVKVFAAGVSASYELNRTSQRVFQVILDQYQRTPMTGGYADSVYLAWFDGGLSGESVGMSEATFNRGMRELLSKGFIAAKMPNVYWVNPALFFKGDRVMFIKEYHRRRISSDEAAALEKQTQNHLEAKE